jgi:hypothetical protein
MAASRHPRRTASIDYPCYHISAQALRTTNAGCSRGPQNKMTDPDVVGWFLGGPKHTRVGQIFSIVFIVLCNSPHRENINWGGGLSFFL